MTVARRAKPNAEPDSTVGLGAAVLLRACAFTNSRCGQRSKNSAEDRAPLLPCALMDIGRCSSSLHVELASTGYLAGFCQVTSIPPSAQRYFYILVMCKDKCFHSTSVVARRAETL